MDRAAAGGTSILAAKTGLSPLRMPLPGPLCAGSPLHVPSGSRRNVHCPSTDVGTSGPSDHHFRDKSELGGACRSPLGPAGLSVCSCPVCPDRCVDRGHTGGSGRAQAFRPEDYFFPWKCGCPRPLSTGAEEETLGSLRRPPDRREESSPFS